MDEAQAGQLGSKMRDAYANIATEPAIVTEPRKKHVSRRLRKSPTFAHHADGAANDHGTFMRQHPIASLLVAASLGFLLSRL